MRITEHGYLRGRKRLKFQPHVLEKMAARALVEGVSHREAKGHLRKYLDKEHFYYPNGNIIVFNEHAFVFARDNGDLVTVYRMPNNLIKLCNQIQHRKKPQNDRKSYRIEDQSRSQQGGHAHLSR
jgi:hypothetical protein